MLMYHNNHGRTTAMWTGNDDRDPRFPGRHHCRGDGAALVVLDRRGYMLPLGAIVGKAMAMASMGQPQKDGARNTTGSTSDSARVSSERGVVLVVEDEPAIADLLRMYLSREGFQVLVESDGQRALSAVSEFRPPCILLDVGLPGMDGIEVRRRLRADQDWTRCCSAPHVTTRSTVSWDWNSGRRLHH